MDTECSNRKGLLEKWKPKRYQIEDKILELQIEKIKLLDESKEKDKIKTIKQKEKYYKKILKKLKCLRKDNWATDPDLPRLEKAFHWLVFVFGIILLVFALKLLWLVVDKNIQGVGSMVSVVVLMILIIFSFLCISGRGLETVEKLKNRIENVELVKLWGFTIKGFHKNE